MKHFGIFITDLESERFLTASNDQIATWLFLHGFCSRQTNGGTIQGAAELPERFWSRHGINASIVSKASPLWSWNESDLSIHPYDIGGEELYLKKVAGGKKGMETRWKGTANKSPDKSLNRPNLTQPNLTQPNQTLPKKKRSSGDDREVSPDGLIFADWFKSLLPETLSLPKNWQKSFAGDYDKMIGIDKRAPDQIRLVCQWARTNDFWKNHIMSPAKLRERKDGIMYFDKLAAQATPSGGHAHKSSLDELMGGRKCVITKASDIGANQHAHRIEKAAREFPEPKKTLPRL